MININLLPWREDRLRFKNRIFATIAATTAIATFIFGFSINTYYASLYSNKVGDNKYLQQEINSVNIKLKQVKKLEENKEKLLGKRDIIESLQINRSFTVKLFDELVYAVPAGVYLEGLKKDKDNLFINGVSESNEEISKLMKNLGSLEWLNNLQLTEIVTATDKEVEAKLNVTNINFTVKATIKKKVF